MARDDGDAPDDAPLTLPVRGAPWLGLGVLVALLAAGALVLMIRDPAGESADAGVDAYRPMIIGMPVVIARSTVVPLDEAEVSRLAAAEPTRGDPPAAPSTRRPLSERSTRASSAGPSAGSGPNPVAGATEPPSVEPSTGSAPTGSPSGGRTLAAADGPAAQAAAAAYRLQAQRVVQQRYLSQIQDCFDAATARDPSLSGEVTLGYVPADDGSVLSSRAVLDTIGAGVGDCVARSARTWQLPPPPPNALELRMTFAL
ncbi:MAG: hypothetical protein CMN30_07940 [Sandaracinus sp.]|nr:hypothetical protein [Sandaracinus sp.]